MTCSDGTVCVRVKDWHNSGHIAHIGAAGSPAALNDAVRACNSFHSLFHDSGHIFIVI